MIPLLPLRAWSAAVLRTNGIRAELKPEYDTDHHINDTDRRCIYYDDPYQYSDTSPSPQDTPAEKPPETASPA